MNIQSSTKHERTTFVHFNEDQLHAALASAVMKEANIQPGKHVSVKVFISHKDRTGTAGVEKYAEVTITENLNPPPDAMEPQA